MSTRTDKKPGKGLYLLPLVFAAPVAAAAVVIVRRFWPIAHKLLSIIIKLVVRA